MRKLVLQVKLKFKISRQILPTKISPTNCTHLLSLVPIHIFPFFFLDKSSQANFLPTSFLSKSYTYVTNYTMYKVFLKNLNIHNPSSISLNVSNLPLWISFFSISQFVFRMECAEFFFYEIKEVAKVEFTQRYTKTHLLSS